MHRGMSVPLRTGVENCTGMSVPLRTGVENYAGMSVPVRTGVENPGGMVVPACTGVENYTGMSVPVSTGTYIATPGEIPEGFAFVSNRFGDPAYSRLEPQFRVLFVCSRAKFLLPTKIDEALAEIRSYNYRGFGNIDFDFQFCVAFAAIDVHFMQRCFFRKLL